MAQDAKKPEAANGADSKDNKDEKKKMTKAEQKKEEEMVHIPPSSFARFSCVKLRV